MRENTLGNTLSGEGSSSPENTLGNRHTPGAHPFGQNTEQSIELIEATELAKRWRVPVSWIRNRTRERTPSQERIPCVRLGRYVRFEWGSPRLEEWLAKQRD